MSSSINSSMDMLGISKLIIIYNTTDSSCQHVINKFGIVRIKREGSSSERESL
jgi:hypothetical protein